MIDKKGQFFAYISRTRKLLDRETMTLKGEKRTTNSILMDEESLQHHIKQTYREIHEFLGLLEELTAEQADHTSPHYRKFINTTLHTILGNTVRFPIIP